MSFYITTPIYYVNAQPHLGHAYTTIAADVAARHMRQRGEDVFFLTGTDEHGEPVADAAAALGLEPRELADRNAEKFKALAPIVDATNDFFIRTSDEEHKERVQQVLQRVHDNGYVYKGLYEGWYCPRCADFKVENEILEGNLCPIHEIPLIREQEANWFFQLSSFQGALERHFADNRQFVMPGRAMNEAQAFIAQGLQDVSLSRAKLNWGVTVPWDPSHVFYVWFDALLNYYTALSYARPGEDLTDRYWPATLHVIGKDILKFHTIFWPALLLAADIALPEHVFVHGFLLGGDGPVGMDAVTTRYESELANEYGNLASRSIAMILRYRDGVVPQVATDPVINAEFDGLALQIAELFDRAEPTQALELIWQRVRRLNRYVEERAPWQLARDPAVPPQLDQTLATLYEGVRAVSVLLHPYMPASVET